MRTLIAATCSAGVAVVVASPAIAGAPPPVPPDAAIAQYVEAVPTATGLAQVGGVASPVSGARLETAVRAKVERAAGADAPALLQIAQNPRFGARPVSRPKPTPAAPRRRPDPAPTITRQAAPASIETPSPLAAAASTAGSGGLLLVALLLVAITAAGVAVKAARR
jgi:hypothetical protein